MRIAVNTRLLVEGKMDGIGWFTFETVKRMVAEHPEHTFYLFYDRRSSARFVEGDNVVPVVLCPQARHPILWYMFFEWAVQRALRSYKIDLFLSPDGMMPLRPAAPTLAVIHDLNFEHASDNLRPSHQRYMTAFFPRFARAAKRVATVSEFSKHDICNLYGIDADRVDVVYDGAHAFYRPHSEEEKSAIRHEYADGCRYIIFVSTILKRKNLANLLLAFDKVLDEDSHASLKLLVVGAKAWWQDELAAAYDGMRHRSSVIMPGRVEPDKLAALMSASEALVYPSYFEGFGIPILEAMYAETAVICSQTTSMPEVGGDAALYINPSSVDEISRAIVEVLKPDTRSRLVDLGRKQREKYSWDITTHLLWESMMRTVGKR